MKKQFITTVIAVMLTMAVGCQKDVINTNADFIYENMQQYLEGMDAPYTLEFTSLGAYSNASYSWDFGDGETFTSIGEWATHDFDAPGEYLVSLTVKDGDYETSKEQTVLVEGSDIKLECYYEGIDALCYDFTAKIYNSYDNYIDDVAPIDTQICNEDGYVRFRHLNAFDTYYIKAYLVLPSGGYYSNTETEHEGIAYMNKITNLTYTLKYYGK